MREAPAIAPAETQRAPASVGVNNFQRERLYMYKNIGVPKALFYHPLDR